MYMYLINRLGCIPMDNNRGMGSNRAAGGSLNVKKKCDTTPNLERRFGGGTQVKAKEAIEWPRPGSRQKAAGRQQRLAGRLVTFVLETAEPAVKLHGPATATQQRRAYVGKAMI